MYNKIISLSFSILENVFLKEKQILKTAFCVKQSW